MVHAYFRVTGTHESIFDVSDLMGVTLLGDDVQGSATRWDEVLLSIRAQDHILACRYKMRTCDSEQLKTVLALFCRDIEQEDLPPSHHKLKTMVKKFLPSCIDIAEEERWREFFERWNYQRRLSLG